MATESATLRLKAREALAAQKQPSVTPLSSLLAVQDALGYLPVEGVEEVAAFTSSTINDVWGVASFYLNFRFTPAPEHTVEVCWGPTCHLMGAPRILEAFQEVLGVTGESETSDGKFALKYNTCLGACSQAPAISIDHHLVGRVEPRRIVEGLARSWALPFIRGK